MLRSRNVRKPSPVVQQNTALCRMFPSPRRWRLMGRPAVATRRAQHGSPSCCLSMGDSKSADHPPGYLPLDVLGASTATGFVVRVRVVLWCAARSPKGAKLDRVRSWLISTMFFERARRVHVKIGVPTRCDLGAKIVCMCVVRSVCIFAFRVCRSCSVY